MPKEERVPINQFIDGDYLSLALEYVTDSVPAERFFLALHNLTGGRPDLTSIVGLPKPITDILTTIHTTTSSIEKATEEGKADEVADYQRDLEDSRQELTNTFLKECKVLPGLEASVRSTTRYFSTVVEEYGEKPGELFMATVESLGHLPEARITSTLDSLCSFIHTDREVAFDGIYIVPLLVTNVLSKLGEEYAARFENLSKRHVAEDKPEYKQAITELQKDMGIFLEYARQKLGQKQSFNVEGNKISYEDCFPGKNGKERDYAALDQDYVWALVEGRNPGDNALLVPDAAKRILHPALSDEQLAALSVTPTEVAVATLVQNFGVPYAAQPHGKRGNQEWTARLVFGDTTNPHPLSVEHVERNGPVQKFYQALTTVADRLDPANVGNRGQFKAFVNSGH